MLIAFFLVLAVGTDAIVTDKGHRYGGIQPDDDDFDYNDFDSFDIPVFKNKDKQSEEDDEIIGDPECYDDRIPTDCYPVAKNKLLKQFPTFYKQKQVEIEPTEQDDEVVIGDGKLKTGSIELKNPGSNDYKVVLQYIKTKSSKDGANFYRFYEVEVTCQDAKKTYTGFVKSPGDMLKYPFMTLIDFYSGENKLNFLDISICPMGKMVLEAATKMLQLVPLRKVNYKEKRPIEQEVTKMSPSFVHVRAITAPRRSKIRRAFDILKNILD